MPEEKSEVVNVRMAPGAIEWIDQYIEKTHRYKSRSEFVAFAAARYIDFIVEFGGFQVHVAEDNTKKE